MNKNIRIAINEPCHENWDKMSPAESGRFCAACQKQVVDFSAMTDKEIFEHISTSLQSVCGRASADQLDRELSVPSLTPKKPALKLWMGWAASMLMMVSTRSLAQSKPRKVIKPDRSVVRTMGTMAVIVVDPKTTPKKTPPTTQQNAIDTNGTEQILMEFVDQKIGTVSDIKERKSIPVIAQGRVIDADGTPVSYASVIVHGSSKGVVTDSLGNFELELHSPAAVSLSISSVGLQQKTIYIDANQVAGSSNGKLFVKVGDISMEPVAAVMGEVTVVARNCNRLSGRVGGVAYVRTFTTWQYAKDTVKTALGIAELKVYPNPVTKNGRFNIQFRLKQKGEYTLQFLDGGGHIIGGSRLNIVASEQVESFDSHMFSAGGIYYAVARASNGRDTYTTRIIVP